MQTPRETWYAALADLSRVEVRVIETAAIIVGLILLRMLMLVIVRNRTSDARVRYHWRKGTTYALAVIGLFAIGRVWFVGFRSVATFLGLVAAGLVIALKEPLSNLAAWFFMVWRRPFTVGDRIQIGDHAGDVIDISMLHFSILEIGNWVGADQSTGRVIHIPNGRLFEDPVANYTREFPYLWNEIEVVITFESDWRAAKALLTEIANRHGKSLSDDAERELLLHASRFMIFYSTLQPVVYTSVNERGISLALRYLCAARNRRTTEQAIWEDVLETFSGSESIDFAYPTQRFFDRSAEDRTLGTRTKEPPPIG